MFVPGYILSDLLLLMVIFVIIISYGIYIILSIINLFYEII